MWLFFLLLLFFSFLQAVFLPFNLVILLILFLTLKEKGSITAVFIAGLAFDLISGFPLGLSSLVFLLLVMIVRLTRTAWYFWGIVFLLVLASSTIFSYLQTFSWQIRPALMTLALGIGLGLIFKLFGAEVEGSGKLRI